MNQKQGFIIGVIVLLIIGVLWYTQTPKQPEEVQVIGNEQGAQEGDITLHSENTTVSYRAQKKFFSRPTEEITGVNTNVVGYVRINNESNTFDVTLDIATDSFQSGSAQRDSDITQLLGGPIQVYGTNLDTTLLQQASEGIVVPLEVTINNITQTVNFTAQGAIEDSNLLVSGAGEIVITDFGINAPSVLTIYEVDELIQLTFETILQL